MRTRAVRRVSLEVVAVLVALVVFVVPFVFMFLTAMSQGAGVWILGASCCRCFG